MGECVGVAAAMASLGGVDFLDIDYKKYLSRVNERGCFSGYSDRRFGFDNTYNAYRTKMKSLGRIPDEKYEGMKGADKIYEPVEFDVDKSFELLKTDAPGVAIWSCFISSEREKVAERLYSSILSADTDLYRYNCAIALGLIEDKRALPILKEIVSKRDCFFFTDNRRSNQFRSAIAVCLMGRLGEECDLDMLFDILREDEIDKPMYHTLEANYLYHASSDRNFVYFAMLTHTCMAIYNIYNRHGLSMKELHSFFAELFSGDRLMRRVTDAKSGEPAYEELDGFMKYVLKITE